MSQIPPPPPDTSTYDSSLPYSGTPQSSALALTSMILGIASIPLVCAFGLGFLTGIAAAIMGIIALTKISKDPQQYGGKGMAIAGIATGGGGLILLVPLLIAILLPGLGKARELSNRSVCAANLRGIAQSMVVYAADNADDFPYLGPKSIAAKPPTGDTPGGLMHDMFYFVSSGSVASKQFLCKSDPASTVASVPGGTYWTSDFGYSYSFAFQYSEPTKFGAWWRNDMDASVALGADMNPGAENTKAVKNSLNHQGDGQNIAFGDGHCEFARTPCAGESGDHIYTSNTPSDPSLPGMIGQPPFASKTGGTMGTFDTCLVPGLADKAYTRR